MITYSDINETRTNVYLDKIKVGQIFKKGGWWYYQPRHSKETGAPMHTKDAVKRSLES